jgi:hypothetical protein
VTILLQLAGDDEALAQVGSASPPSCPECRTSRLPLHRPTECGSSSISLPRKTSLRVCGSGDFSDGTISPVDQGGRGQRCPPNQYPLLYAASTARAGPRPFSPGPLHEHRCRNWRQGVIQGVHRAERLTREAYRRGSSTMFDAKLLLDSILGGQTAQQATAAAQSAGSTVAGVVSQAEESLKEPRSAKR